VQAALDAAGFLTDSARHWLTIARAFVAAALIACFWRDYVELAAAPRARTSDWLLAAGAGILVFIAWIAFDTGWAVVGGGARGFVPATPIEAALRLVGFAAIVPVMEELFWRSFLMRWIEARDFLAFDPRKTGLRAFALSSALFASEHSLWFAGLLAGIAYGWVYKRSGNLWTAIFSHAVTNGALGIWILATGSWKSW